MASRDPRLQWRALSQPDLSAASQAVARAAAAFQAGMDGARSSLETADEARRRRNSAEVASELMGLESPEAIQQWLENGGLNGRDIDPAIMESMLGMQGDMTNRELDRARIESVQTRDGLAVAAADLAATERADEEASQAEFDELLRRIETGGSGGVEPGPAAAPGPTAAVPDTFRIGGPPMELAPDRFQWGQI